MSPYSEYNFKYDTYSAFVARPSLARQKNNNIINPYNKQKKLSEMETPAQEDTMPVVSRTTV